MRRSHYVYLLVTAIILIIVDQLTKHLIRTAFQLNAHAAIIPGILSITYLQNTGALFGMFHNLNAIFIWLSVMAAGFLLYTWESFPETRFTNICRMLILAGLAGNLIDRILLGYVTDFISISIWPVFNLADSMVSLGVIGFIAQSIKDMFQEKGKKPHKRH
jgi:signal peptidase II